MLIADWRIDIWIEIHLSYSSGVNRGGRVFDAFAPICFSFILRFIRFPEPVDNFCCRLKGIARGIQALFYFCYVFK